MNLPENIIKANTLIDILQYRATNQRERIAYIFLVDGETETTSLTYWQLQQQSKAIAAALQSHYSPGEVALLLYPPSLEYITAFFGCLMAGIIAIPVYPPRPNRSIQRLQGIMADTHAKVALTTQSVLANLERSFSHTPELETMNWLATDSLDVDLAEKWQSPNINRDTIAFLQYTSGSTATPKGVMITHHNLLSNLTAIYQYFEITSSSKLVSWLPMYHDMGLIGGILEPLYAGVPVTLMSPLMFLQNPLRWLKAISHHKATVSGAPNFAYDFCVKKISNQLSTQQIQDLDLDLSCWELAFNGAEPINYQTLENFITAFEPYGFRRETFYPCYGMAEATLIISGGKKSSPFVTKTVSMDALENDRVIAMNLDINNLDDHNIKIAIGCGQTLPQQEIVIVNPDTLTPCQKDEVGEIWVKGNSIAKGYWNQLEATQNSFQAYLADSKDGPFLRTGDLGFLDHGELFITGRLKDLIIINGSNFYPQDIEWIIEENIPSIKSSCSAAFSISFDGKECLVIVAEVDRSFYQLSKSSDDFSTKIKELIRSIRRTVTKNFDLEVYQILLLKPGTIPKTSSGKIQRNACRKKYLENTLDVIN